ncbi:hypothetical protein B1C78_08250 [Thioalkalivibrio denitrificans]|uniref:Uncharacterized protein n=1 Tax=Thioalkalivibrio denitrificans TaxID=108003 RepID=A0A1V3NIX5_9GAMM|nr:hypothetical protein [Thioalkalivibrio denitrificans]OOG24802.1 hypothetical protein B1C78_08250 [Thioalkalivibrio denitrificans]
MTLNELLQYLHDHSEFQLLDGTPQESLRKAVEETHSHPVAAEIIRALNGKAGDRGGEARLERIDAVKCLGPLRLKYMADDAPVEGFRMVEKTITTIDAAYNEEALRHRES